MQTVEHNDVLEIAQAEHTKSNTTNKGEGNGRQGKIQHSENSKGKHSIPSGPISLKVKFGSRSLMDVVPLIDDHSDKRCTAEKESYDVQNVTKNIDDRLEAKLQFGGCNGDLDNVHDPVADIFLSGNKCSQDSVDKFSPSQEGTCTDNRCSDSGTSPDSEVINLVPNERDLEELNDLVISKPSVTLPGLCVYDRSKNGRKMDRLLSSGAKDLLTPDSMSNTQIIGQVIQVLGDSYYSDTSALITGQIGSANISSTEIVSAQVLPCSGVSNLGISCDTSKFESGVEGNIFSSLGTESVKLVSSHDGLNVFKGEKSNGFGKGSSQVPKPSNTSIKKGNREDQANKHELRNDSDDVKSLCKVKHHPKTENEAPYKFGDFGSCNETLIGGTSDLDIMRTEVSEPYLKPRKAWVQCDDCQKWRRIASALADQIEETNCKWTCKDSLDRDFADCLIAQEKSNSEINAELEISDASGDEDTFSICINSNRSGQKKAPVVHQSSWNLIKTNLFLHRNRKNQPNDEFMVCHCKQPSDGRMGCGDGCLNRMLNVECVRGTCPCGELCSNQQFQKRNYSKLKWFKCGKKGYGLQLLEDVYEGHFLIEYVGEVLDLHAYEARQKEYALKGHKHFYFMTLNGSEVIDACAKGNLGRFINHSCDPNCRTEKWLVNGEVCIGLFALRDIKKGEEVTFDYNYVRVFGAAAKKCVCGSPHCRGYIGGDPLNAEVIVQDDSDDDYPEPVILCEYGDMGDELNNILSARNATDVIEITTQGKALKNKNKLDEPFIEDLECTQDTMDHENSSMDDSVAVISLKIKEETNKFHGGSLKNVESYETMQQGLESLFESSLQPLGLQSKDVNNETMSQVKKECLDAEKVSSVLEMEKFSPSKSVRKKSSNGGVSDELSKPSRRSSSVKKGKLKYSAVILTSQSALDSKLQIPQPKFKKPPYESSNSRFEEVEEKLNELLNHDGGISKRRDASRCYLKLLLLTAASGHGCNGEAIQSNRDLSMILDALLKTKSRTVLLDIINKNGLQMLHNIMKRYRREFNKIPILRKLLKILEYLAVKGILSPEHINGGPSRPGVESFRDSIMRLTDHTDKQVHQIARNFRDRWIPKPVRKSSCIDSQVDLRSCSRYNRFSPLQDQRGVETSEKPESSCRLIVESTATADGADGSSTSCLVNGERKRKRKSRWDQKAEFNLDERVESNGADDPRQDIDDVPPGFSLKTSGVSCDASSSGFWKHPYPMVTGHLQQRFISQLPVSYGIPLSKVQQFGLPQKDGPDAWDVAPGVPFHPFPPLPTYPRDTSASMPSTATAGTFPHGSVQERYTAQKPPCLSHDGSNTQISLQQHDNLGRKYFRQQKHLNYSERVPCPRERSGGECIGDSSKNCMHKMGVASRENEARSCQNTRNEKLAHKSQQSHS